MSRMLELPDDVYEAMEDYCTRCGTTPEAWFRRAFVKPADNGPLPEGTSEGQKSSTGARLYKLLSPHWAANDGSNPKGAVAESFDEYLERIKSGEKP